MSDLFGASPPVQPPPKPTRRKAAGAAQTRRPAAEPHTEQAEPPASAEPPAACPPRLYRQVTLHDGRMVDSGSEEWRMECLASTLLQMSAAEQYDWINGYGTAEAQQALRMRIHAIKSSRSRRRV